MNNSIFISIRPYSCDDIDVLIDLFRKAVRQGAVAHYSDVQREAWAPDDIDRDAWIAKCSRKPTWVAVSNAIVIGFADLEPDGHIDMLYVHPDYHRQGVGRTLLLHIESVARRQLISRLYTEASIGARPVFDRAGFALIKEQIVLHNGQRFVNFYMQKQL